jgi:Vault protein inter-alpha-trypsin domain
MAYFSRNNVAGIVWDPREPLPIDLLAELGEQGIDAREVQEESPFVVRQPDQNILPPLSTRVTARVIDDIARVTVYQLFQSASNAPIPKGSYTFPLPNGCTVTEFSCRFGLNKIVSAKVSPKQEARDAFDHAVRNDQSAGLLEQETSEIFTTTLGNIPAKTKLKAEISFVTFLKHRFADSRSTITLSIPTYISPRYGEPPPGFRNPSGSGYLRGLSIVIEVVGTDTVQNISSNTHRITVERGVGTRQFESWEEFAAAAGTDDSPSSIVKLEEEATFLDRDFVLDISTQPRNGLEAPHAWLEVHPSLENHKAVMLTTPPNFMLRHGSSSEDGEILFVADRSGSMDDKMESLKSAMAFFLKGIPLGRMFNIWCFGTNHS